jgi:hypothetical protein
MTIKKHDQVRHIEIAPQTVIQAPLKEQRQTKQALLLELISREGGANLQDLTSATGWLPHTARAAITGLRKRGHDVQCQRAEGVSRYTLKRDGK